MSYYKTDSSGNRIPAQEGGILNLVETITANKTLTVEDSGKSFLIGTDALVIALPATVEGVNYTFLNSGIAGNNIMTISPSLLDGISGTVTLAGTVVILDGTVNKDVINTKVTSKTGDVIRIVGTGVTGKSAWLKTYSDGIFARQV